MNENNQKQVLEDFMQASVEWVAALMRADSGQDTADQFLTAFAPFEAALKKVRADTGAEIGADDFLSKIKTVTENFIRNEPEGIDSQSFAEVIQQVSDEGINGADTLNNAAHKIHQDKFTNNEGTV